MDIQLQRIPASEPNRVKITLPEGTITIVGTPGLVTNSLAVLMTPGTTLNRLILEHIDPETLYETWRAAAAAAGFALPDQEG